MTDSGTSPTVESAERKVVLVSGPPGSGKSSLALPLAEALGFALLSKDRIKETLWDALRPSAASRSWSRRIGGSAMEVIWALARCCPEVVLEANFRPRSEYERWRLNGLGARIVEVYCCCPLDVARERFAQRATMPDHHPAHVDRAVTPESLAEFGHPFGRWPVILADTTKPVDIPTLCADITAALAGPSVQRGTWHGRGEHDASTAEHDPVKGDLETRVHDYLLGAGQNPALSEGLRKGQRWWVGPAPAPIAHLTPTAGPEADMIYRAAPSEWTARVDDMSRRIRGGWRPPPLIIESVGDDLLVRDGNLCHEAHRRASLTTATVVIWFSDEAAWRAFDQPWARNASRSPGAQP